jgi:hypothetical protein
MSIASIAWSRSCRGVAGSGCSGSASHGRASASLPQVSREFTATYPEIPWENIVGMRHNVARYLDVDEDVVWWGGETEDLPKLVVALELLVTPAP